MKTIFKRIAILSLLGIFFTNCEKDEVVPTVTTLQVNGITSVSAVSGGEITSDGGASVIERGVCWNTNGNPTILDTKTTDDTGIGTYTSNISGLSAGLTYYVRAYATNSVGTSYGRIVNFRTLNIPILTTTKITLITSKSAVCGGVITSDAGAEITTRGVCWNTTGNPTVADSKTNTGKGIGTFISCMPKLRASTTYYVRAYATNSIGTSYGDTESFTTNSNLAYGTMTDIDNNTYKTVIIGTQIWMAENLKVTHYNDSVAIPNVTNGNTWANLVTGAYCYYLNDYSTYGTVFGALYNWYAVNTEKLAPKGWHVPTYAEWETLIAYLDGADEAGRKLKEAGTEHWIIDTGATNEFGFTALPGDLRYYGGRFEYGVGAVAAWWSATKDTPNYAYYRYMVYEYDNISSTSINMALGMSVRCVKD